MTRKGSRPAILAWTTAETFLRTGSGSCGASRADFDHRRRRWWRPPLHRLRPEWASTQATAKPWFPLPPQRLSSLRMSRRGRTKPQTQTWTQMGTQMWTQRREAASWLRPPKRHHRHSRPFPRLLSQPRSPGSRRHPPPRPQPKRQSACRPPRAPLRSKGAGALPTTSHRAARRGATALVAIASRGASWNLGPLEAASSNRPDPFRTRRRPTKRTKRTPTTSPGRRSGPHHHPRRHPFLRNPFHQRPLRRLLRRQAPRSGSLPLAPRRERA